MESRHVLVDERRRPGTFWRRTGTSPRGNGPKQNELPAWSGRPRRGPRPQAAATARDALQEVLDALPGGVLLMAAPDARIEFANAAMVELIFGASPARIGECPVYGQDFRFLRADGTPLPADEQPGVRALQGRTMCRTCSSSCGGPMGRRCPWPCMPRPCAGWARSDPHGDRLRPGRDASCGRPSSSRTTSWRWSPTNCARR